MTTCNNCPNCTTQVPCEIYTSHQDIIDCCEAIATIPDPSDPTQTIPNPDASITERARKIASEMLFYATGQQYQGCCQKTLRPCWECGDCNNLDLFGGAPWVPALVNGAVLNIRCGDGCSCTNDCYVDLGEAVRGVDAVYIDGEALPTSDYELYGGRFLRLIPTSAGGSGVIECWPQCNQPKRAVPCVGELGGAGTPFEGTWAVVVTAGNPAPDLLRQAAAELACHFQQLCPGEAGCQVCKVPRNATQVTKGGATYQLLDPRLVMDNFANTPGMIRTGIWEVDIAIKTLNPHGFTKMGGVYSPDIQPPAREY